jgi:hypothetical protein
VQGAIARRSRFERGRIYNAVLCTGLPFIYRDGMTLTFRLFFDLERIFGGPLPGQICFLDVHLLAGAGSRSS